MSPRILLVEDEPGLRLALIDRLHAEGYEAAAVADGNEGFRRATEEHFDLCILDVMLPGGRSGFDLCRDLRQRGLQTPIIMLTARGEVVDRVVGLKLGADDYVLKPFEMAELLARVEARLRGHAAHKTTQRDAYSFGPVHVDFKSGVATRDQQTVDLSAKEFQLLRYLIEHRGTVLSRDQLLNGVWGYDAMPTTRTVDVHVAGLRRKLEPNPRVPQFILTLHGLGYKFVG
jgi:two-component system, OmpR family, alkaline phosphatase synthesis response regulator PhoP